MIPNVRVMMVALFASIVAISCGLGLFAAFRVNHEQFGGAPNGSPILQMAFAVPVSVTDAAAVADRSRMDMPAANAAAPDAAAIQDDGSGQETPQATGNDQTGSVTTASPVDRSPLIVEDTNPAPRAPSAEAAPRGNAMKKMTHYRAGRLRHLVPSQAATAAAPGDQPAAVPRPAVQSARKPPRHRSSGVTYWSSDDPQ